MLLSASQQQSNLTIGPGSSSTLASSGINNHSHQTYTVFVRTHVAIIETKGSLTNSAASSGWNRPFMAMEDLNGSR